MLSRINACWQAFPYTAAAVVCGTKVSAVNWITQMKQQHEKYMQEEGRGEPTLSANACIDDLSSLLSSSFLPLDVPQNVTFLLYANIFSILYILNGLERKRLHSICSSNMFLLRCTLYIYYNRCWYNNNKYTNNKETKIIPMSMIHFCHGRRRYRQWKKR